MANKNAANINNATNNTREEKTMNYTTMKKADLIALIEEKDRELRVAELKIEGLGQALKAVKATMKKFCGGMNDIFTAELVKNATAETPAEKNPDEEKVEAPRNTKKVKAEAERAVQKDAETQKPEKKRWLTKEEYKAQFTPEQQEAWKQEKQAEAKIRNEVAAEMRAEAKKTGVYWKKAAYKVEFEKRVNARKEAK
jgi:hypothetical protein